MSDRAAAAGADILAWAHDVTDIPERGLDVTRSASAAELGRIAAELDLVACDALAARYRIKPVAGGGYRVRGDITARVEQRCIVTLEPVAAEVAAPIEVEYWPSAGREGEDEDGEMEALSAAEVEPLEHGRIDIGRIVFEQLAAGLDPYPRKTGAEFTPPPEAPAGAATSGPFAGLARLKKPEE